MGSLFDDSKDYFTFSRSERRGILVLIIVILILIITPIFIKSYVTIQSLDNSQIKAKVDSFFASISSNQPEFVEHTPRPIEELEGVHFNAVEYFSFDPNTAKVDELVQLGLSVKQAQVIDRYRSKGGIFRNPDDFSKIFVIDSNLFNKLKPWININPNFTNKSSKAFSDSIHNVKMNPIIVELNTADTLELINVRGIGKSFARRIIAYRDLLGGFVNIKQLKEVYGMRTELLSEINKSLKVDSTLIKTINLNLVSFEDIKKHPYITEYQAKAIIYYRSKVGVIKNLSELVSNKILPNEKLERLKKYLVLQ